ncbi:MAG: CHASE2 domain-containing protein [Candidatus Omnitrophica bacterium]|nr:CHASE2 domain-containing protein [Candidatus Omnitrophota bacterium]
MKPTSRLTPFQRILLIFCIALLFTLVLSQSAFFKSLENKAYDSLFYFRQPLADKDNNVVIVAIDEESMKKVGNWPWPRERLAKLIEIIKKGKPKVIGVDLLLDIPAVEDEKLAEAFSVPPAAVLPMVVREDGAKGREDILLKPLDIFLAGYTRVGVTNISSDPVDKTTRDFRPLYNGRRLSYPLAVCLEYLGMGPDDVRVKRSSVDFGGYSVPVYHSRALINYKCAKIGKFSAGDVMESSFDPAFFFEGKVVLLGRTDLASKDFINTPVTSGKIFETVPLQGVELWKEAIDTVLEKNFIYRLPPAASFLVLLILSVIISALTFSSDTKGAVGVAATLLVSAAVFYGLFLKRNLVIPVLPIAAMCLASYVMSFLYNYTKRIAYKKRMETELEFAWTIQRNFLPQEFPEGGNFSIYASMSPARTVGGDFYDVSRLDEKRIEFMIGDVSGKGIPAALFMAKTLARVNAISQRYADANDPSLILKELNATLLPRKAGNTAVMFATLIYGIFFPEEKKIIAASAGHPAPYLYKKGQWENIALENGIVAGIMEGAAYLNTTIRLKEGEAVAFFTDGFLEANDTEGNTFIPAVFSKLPPVSAGADAVGKAIEKGFATFVGKAGAADDATLLVINSR